MLEDIISGADELLGANEMSKSYTSKGECEKSNSGDAFTSPDDENTLS